MEIDTGKEVMNFFCRAEGGDNTYVSHCRRSVANSFSFAPHSLMSLLHVRHILVFLIYASSSSHPDKIWVMRRALNH